ncbi:twin-arginine translocation signal domain-containing protein [Duganella qianjiadongensis]|uniref:Twin-arginine translocation signal domain-containing protein n=1 Tax=Duganella qianjiadongensis TaxID=2692176 RepID=A0ABW9VHR2_9BURK|nr:twin-arginine translocation signal domain-containing protein [Duganella qianjiadongensis]MYM38185.1 twin-arginine translocation signal domain-containing protein [Duganella qianjiadongensis]
MSNRRSFLKIGAAAAITLAAGGAIYRMVTPSPLPHPFALDGQARAALNAIIPALLGPLLPADAATRGPALEAALARTHGAILGLPLNTQKEIQDLFGLLALAPARRLLAGVSDSWEQARPAEVADFLQSWRNHRLAMLQIAYLALHDLVLGSWYADPSSWAAIGYPGPRKELLK